jgi:thiamine pyrophosphokinase
MNKVILVVAGGEISDLVFFRSKISELKPAEIICADSGAGYLRAIGLVPHVIIGDMDSLKPDMLKYFKERGSRIIRFPEGKNETDTQLALNMLLVLPLMKSMCSAPSEPGSIIPLPMYHSWLWD